MSALPKYPTIAEMQRDAEETLVWMKAQDPKRYEAMIRAHWASVKFAEAQILNPVASDYKDGDWLY